ncbi:MAG: branched-chain amino acid ABC transporter permease [Candidatus Rokubacteria bacterium]|nr:branched-chain amino acid ABC transporter permease [Candidatus Rokubacteria bacterium]
MIRFLAEYFGWLTDPSLVLMQLLSGIAGAMFLFLVASGLSLIFGVSRIVNFAHGSLYMFGAYFAYTWIRVLAGSPGQFWIMLILASLTVAVMGGVLEVIFVRRIYRADPIFQLLLTFAFVLVLSDIAKIFWGAEGKAVPKPGALAGSVKIFGAPFPTYLLLVVAAGLGVGLILWIVFYRTRWGRLVRAARHSRDMLAALGSDVPRLFTEVFMVGSGLAGLAGALVAPIVTAAPGMDASIIIEAFVVVVVGGLGSFLGAALASLLVAELKAFGTLVFPAISIVLAYLVMAVVLIFRPWGLFGRREE